MSSLFPWLDWPGLIMSVVASALAAVLWAVTMNWVMRRWPQHWRGARHLPEVRTAMGSRMWIWHGISFGFYMLLFFLMKHMTEHYGMGDASMFLIFGVALVPMLAMVPVTVVMGQLLEKARKQQPNL